MTLLINIKVIMNMMLSLFDVIGKHTMSSSQHKSFPMTEQGRRGYDITYLI